MTVTPFCLLDAPTVPWEVCDPSDAGDTAIELGAHVRYTWRGVDSFYGSVVSIDAAGRVLVECEGDGEPCWCAASRLVLILAPSAAGVR